MANQKISQLTNGNPPQTGDQIPINRGGSNFSITAGNLSAIVNTANQGFLMLPVVGSTSGTASIAGAANRVCFLSVVVPFQIIVGQLTAEVIAVSASATQAADFGLYSADGTSLVLQTNAGVNVSTGVTPAAYTVPVKGFGGAAAPVQVNPGVYLFAYTCSDAAVTFRVPTFNPFINLMQTLATKKWGQAGNSGTSGLLPATLGTLTSAGVTNIPYILLER